MMSSNRGLFLAILLGLSGVPPGASKGAAPVEAGEAADLSRWTGTGADVHLGGAPGAEVLRITFQPGSYPNAHVSTAAPMDWRGQSLVLKLTNPARGPVDFNVRVDDDPGADGKKHTRAGSGTIQARETATYALSMAPAHGRPGSMRGLPPVEAGARSLRSFGDEAFDAGHIYACQIYLRHASRPVSLDLDSVRLLPAPLLEKIVDRFGQYTGGDWPGKVHEASELTVRRSEEAASLRADPVLPDRDRFGGWTGGPHLAPTPFFTTRKVSGKWWLVTPDGHLFFSVGMDTMRDEAWTFTGGERRAMFIGLPGPDDPLVRHAGEHSHPFQGVTLSGPTFDFYGANLERKYGPGYAPIWRKLSLDRLRAWGFNTAGNGSPEFVGNGQVPYVATVSVGGAHARISSGSDYWGKMHDPFDPRFATDVGESIGKVAAPIENDPWCIGYLVDNEMSWGGIDSERSLLGLAYGALAETAASSPAKQALLAQLQAQYRTISALNARWGTRFAAWQGVEPPWHPRGAPSAAMRADFLEYVKRFAERYFRVVSTELKKADPHHLYLGCRFSSSTPDEVRAAARFCDVVSFNVYAPGIDPDRWSFLNDLDKPCLIGEFHFGALDRGMFSPGLVAAEDQPARGEMYQEYVRSVLDQPAFVGCHWFQYVDEPLTGRWDGENYNIGFVSVTDTPYPELVAAAKAVHREMYARRFGVPGG
jgi:hypothetical protein